MLQRQAASEAALQYPTITSVVRKAQATRSADEETLTSRGNRKYAANMTVVAQLAGVETAQGDILVAYIGGERRGETAIITLPGNGDLFFLTVAGDKAEAIDLVLERNGQTIGYASGMLTYGNNATIGTVEQPVKIDMAQPADGVQLYPLPFEEVLNIRLAADVEADVNITVTDMKGATIARWTDCNVGGQVHVVWTAGSTTPTGVYVVIVDVDGNVTSHKVVKN